MYLEDITPELAMTESEGVAAPSAKPKRVRAKKPAPADFGAPSTEPGMSVIVEPKAKRVRKAKAKAKKAKAPKVKAKAKKPAKAKKAKAKSKAPAKVAKPATGHQPGPDVFAIKVGGEYVKSWRSSPNEDSTTLHPNPSAACIFEQVKNARALLAGLKVLRHVRAGNVVRLILVDGKPQLPKRGRPSKNASG